MPQRYFDKFPTITYANNQVLDITERVIFADNTLTNPYVYYPYDIDFEERPDQFCYRYYGDQYYSWLLYLSNQVVDPYYDWYLTQDQFNSFIELKYGSVDIAQEKIKYYRTNWETGNTLNLSGYEALPASLMHYWTAQYDLNGNIMNFTRSNNDIIVNTNNIRAYNVSNTSFKIDEICYINFDTNNIGKGQVLFTSNTQVYLQHTSGVTLSNTSVHITGSSYIYGMESNVNTAFTTAYNYADTLSNEEAVYYSPVTYYEYENEKNESNKSIQVLDQPYASKVANILKNLLK